MADVEVNKAADGTAPNVSDSAPQATPGNPGVMAGSLAQPPKRSRDGKEIAEGDVMVGAPTPNATASNATPGQPVVEDKIYEAGSVDTKAEKVDMAGVRVDPITGIAVTQIESSAEDYKKPGTYKPGDTLTIPIQAFDSRKLSGDETVTVRGNNVIVNGGSAGYDARRDEDAKIDEKLPRATQREMEAGRKALKGERSDDPDEALAKLTNR